jgi:hypothetical protein
MNVEERNMEEACKKFKSHLGFNNRNVIHVAFSRIDTVQNKLLTICTDYSWHLEYWSIGQKICINPLGNGVERV